MLDALSLDQLRAFIAAAEQGSFSAAGRKLLRAQSVVSQAVSTLEGQIGVVLFDRSLRYPKLTVEGEVLLADAKAIIDGIDTFKARAKAISGGLEAELSVAIDVMFPLSTLTQVARDFALAFPATPLRLYVEALGSVAQHVLEGRCSLGVIGSLPNVPVYLRSERLLGMPMMMVAAPIHPLAKIKGVVSRSDLARHTQLVLTDRTSLSSGQEFWVLSANTWKLGDLGAKQAFLLSGLGWGAMPVPAIADDLATGRLVELHIEDEPAGGMVLPMSVVYPAASAPGPAGRWLIDTLRACALQHDMTGTSSRPPDTQGQGAAS